jgi:hypothetical protein
MRLHFMQEGNERSPYQHQKLELILLIRSQSRENGKVRLISSSIVTYHYEIYACLICKRINFDFRVNIFM